MKPVASFDAVFDILRDPAVRDLAWVIGSPVLPDATYLPYAGRVVDDAWCHAQFQTCVPWLAALDLEPRNLHDVIAARPTRRLGHYFESLIAFWLSHTPNTQIIALNKQVRDAHRTLGEYDFLFLDDRANVCHWEAAVKFYLQAEPVAEQRAFIGPGARDRLDLKLNRTFKRQLELGNTAAGRAALPSGMAINKAQAYIKGYLFYPVATYQTPKAPVPGISGTHLSGWWARYPLATLPQTLPDTGWMILPRLRWLAPARQDADDQVMSNGKMCEWLDLHFAASSEPIQIVELQHSHRQGWREVARGFVLPSNWPEHDTQLKAAGVRSLS